jgi:acyl-CoA dehydrogenase
MDDTIALVLDTAGRIFADHAHKQTLDAAERGEFPSALWQALEENGFTMLGTADSGTELGDAFSLLKLAGRHAIPVPLAETLIGNVLLAESEVAPQSGIVTFAMAGELLDVPWARCATQLICVENGTDDQARLRVFAADQLNVSPSVNIAGEARDHVRLSGEAQLDVIHPSRSADEVELLMALGRAALMAGALEGVLALSVQYAMERKQFGRAIAKFQAVQHQLAVMAGEVAAASRATDGAIQRLASAAFPAGVAVAKSRAGDASGIVAEIAHQVHGAMGFTYEHQLHHLTRRLWAWRDEYGAEPVWQRRLGREVIAAGGDRVWDFITAH